MFYMKKVTAGKDALGEFAPLFARFNVDVLFGEVWSREEALSPKIRSISSFICAKQRKTAFRAPK